MKEYLPVGTVVKLERAEEELFMIVGLLAVNSEGERRDYVAIPYPVGLMGEDHYFFFDHDNIRDIVHKGYEDENHEAFVKLLNAVEE